MTWTVIAMALLGSWQPTACDTTQVFVDGARHDILAALSGDAATLAQQGLERVTDPAQVVLVVDPVVCTAALAAYNAAHIGIVFDRVVVLSVGPRFAVTHRGTKALVLFDENWQVLVILAP